MSGVVKQPCDEGIIKAGQAFVPCSKASQPWILAATILGSSMVFIDGTVVNVALPALQASLNASVIDVQWVVEAYALFLAALLLTGGSLGDHFGRKRIYLLGVGTFALASLWCALVPTINQLIFARALQGVGGALLVPGSLALISTSFEESERGRAIGTWSGFTAITAAIGPVVGGWLIEHASWRAIFVINLPLAAAVVLLVVRHVPESRDPQARRLDISGAILAALCLGLIVFGLIESSRLGFGHFSVITSLIIGIMILVVFLFVESRKQDPMLPLALFRSRNFAGANFLTFFLYSALSGSLFFFPLNLIQVQNYSATAAGAAFLPFVLILFLLSRWSGGLVNKYGARVPLVAGPVIAAIGFALFMRPNVGGRYWTTFFPAVVILGLGMAICVAPLTTTVMNSVSESRAGLASGINNATSRTARLVAVAILSLVMLHAFNEELNRRLTSISVVDSQTGVIEIQRDKLAAAEVPTNLAPESQNAAKRAIIDSFVYGFRWIMLIAAGLAILSALCAWFVIRD